MSWSAMRQQRPAGEQRAHRGRGTGRRGRRVRRATLLCALLLGALSLAALGRLATPAASAAAGAISGLHVQGNTLVNGAGQPLRLLGADRSGTEYACAEGWGIFDGPSDAASVQALAAGTSMRCACP